MLQVFRLPFDRKDRIRVMGNVLLIGQIVVLVFHPSIAEMEKLWIFASGWVGMR